MGVERCYWRDLELLMADLRGEWDERIAQIARQGHPMAMANPRAPSTHDGTLPGFGGLLPGADVQIFTPAVCAQSQAPGTAGRDLAGAWTQPEGSSMVFLFGVGPGGGGGSGRKGTATTVCCGGGGAGAANVNWAWLLASDLPEEVPLYVSAGGTGGAAQATNSTNGNAGGSSNDTFFGVGAASISGSAGYPIFGARRGSGGSGGTASSGTGGSGGDSSKLLGVQGPGGASASTTGAVGPAGSNNTSTSFAPGGGGAGGGLTSANAHSNGGGGGLVGGYWITQGANNNGQTSAGQFNGGPGLNGLLAVALGSGQLGISPGQAFSLPPDRYFQPGCGGGGGASAASGDAVSGGNGGNGFWGAGGGGGGAATDTTSPSSGAGGNGGDGFLIVVSW